MAFILQDYVHVLGLLFLVGEDVGADVVAHVEAAFPCACARVGREEDVVQGEQGGVDGGFVLEYIQRCAGYLLGLQGIDQRLLVHVRASGGVDEIGCGAHHGEFACADDMPHLRGIGEVERDEVGGLQEFVHGDVAGLVLLLGLPRQGAAVVVDDVHAGGDGAAGERLTDAPHADNTEGFAVERVAEVVHHAERLCGAGTQPAVELRDAARDAQHERERQFGGGFDDGLRGVGDADAPFAASVKVDIVEADAQIGNQLQARHTAYHVPRDGLVERGYKDLCLLRGDMECMPLQARKTLGGQVCGECDFHALRVGYYNSGTKLRLFFEICK